ncbi:MAG: DegT/DnrJ/EryC1/StrS family aminotransferase [Candidatus Hydrogenedentes bacterium]|nr:DegT/DnrJ/EryC1/StrS family aminotransferase [Candidatus Hydrogenedentota bacterium]
MPGGSAVGVPFLDLQSQYQSIREEIASTIHEVLESCAFAGGPYVERFEREFATYCGRQFAIGVGSGTDALWLAMTALGVGPEDEVITIPTTFFATAEAISLCGAKPVFVDIDPYTYTMQPELLEDAIGPRTKAIVPVHMFGQPTDMDPVLEIAARHGLKVIEDACQAHGAEYKGRRAGSFGDAGCFSFYPGKNLGAYGEAGAVVVDDDALAQILRTLRDHGQSRKHDHVRIGWNARMDGIQGAVLSVKLKYIESWTDARRRHAREYSRALAELEELVTPFEAPNVRHVYHIYAIRASNRDRLADSLRSDGVQCAIHYPTPIHLQPAYRCLGYVENSFPVAESCADEFLSLPMYPELVESQIEEVVSSLSRHRSAVAPPA